MRPRVPAFLLVLWLVGCDNGLAPTPPVNPGFSGVVRFVPGTWPSADSLSQMQLWVFASMTVPHDSASIVNGILVSPFTIFLYPSLSVSLPLGTDSVAFTFHVPVASYQYVGVLQHYGSDFAITSFKVVGVYQDEAHPGIPRPLTVTDVALAGDVSIRVDFHNPPPQPF